MHLLVCLIRDVAVRYGVVRAIDKVLCASKLEALPGPLWREKSGSQRDPSVKCLLLPLAVHGNIHCKPSTSLCQWNDFTAEMLKTKDQCQMTPNY